MNLNKLLIKSDRREGVPIADYSLSSGNTNVYFRNLEEKLIGHIKESDAVLGAAAWLTSGPILDALSEKYVSMVVQKEDFLRPDIDSSNRSAFKANLKNKYRKLNDKKLSRFSFQNIVSHLSTSGDFEIEGVRCLGNINNERSPAFPRMHNKFLVFCKMVSKPKINKYTDIIEPYAVWTGSFNLTKNAGMSLENAVYIEDKNIAEAYANEFGNILALSEPLNWQTNWVEPEWRIGT